MSSEPFEGRELKEMVPTYVLFSVTRFSYHNIPKLSKLQVFVHKNVSKKILNSKPCTYGQHCLKKMFFVSNWSDTEAVIKKNSTDPTSWQYSFRNYPGFYTIFPRRYELMKPGLQKGSLSLLGKGGGQRKRKNYCKI